MGDTGFLCKCRRICLRCKAKEHLCKYDDRRSTATTWGPRYQGTSSRIEAYSSETFGERNETTNETAQSRRGELMQSADADADAATREGERVLMWTRPGHLGGSPE